MSTETPGRNGAHSCLPPGQAFENGRPVLITGPVYPADESPEALEDERLMVQAAGVVVEALFSELIHNGNGKELNAVTIGRRFLTLALITDCSALRGKNFTALAEEIGCSRATISELAKRFSEELKIASPFFRNKQSCLNYKKSAERSWKRRKAEGKTK